MVFWGYVSELLLAGLLVIFLNAAGWLVPVEGFLEESASSWAAIFGVMLAGAMAARHAFFSVGSNEFGAWLEWKKLGGVFSAGLWSYASLFLVASAICVVLIRVKGTWLSSVGTFFAVLGMLGFFTFSHLVHKLFRLQSVFNLEHRRALEAESQKRKDS